MFYRCHISEQGKEKQIFDFPLPPIKIYKKPEIKNVFQQRPNEQPAVKAYVDLQDQKRESLLQKIASEG
jgi:hypothetical protein